MFLKDKFYFLELNLSCFITLWYSQNTLFLKLSNNRFGLHKSEILSLTIPTMSNMNTDSCVQAQLYPTLCDSTDYSQPGYLYIIFPRKEHWSELPFPTPEVPDPHIGHMDQTCGSYISSLQNLGNPFSPQKLYPFLLGITMLIQLRLRLGLSWLQYLNQRGNHYFTKQEVRGGTGFKTGWLISSLHQPQARGQPGTAVPGMKPEEKKTMPSSGILTGKGTSSRSL